MWLANALFGASHPRGRHDHGVRLDDDVLKKQCAAALSVMVLFIGMLVWWEHDYKQRHQVRVENWKAFVKADPRVKIVAVYLGSYAKWHPPQVVVEVQGLNTGARWTIREKSDRIPLKHPPRVGQIWRPSFKHEWFALELEQGR